MADAMVRPKIAPGEIGKYVAQIALVFVVYFAAGNIGQVLQISNSGGIGPVWPASGIALAAVLLFGYRIWPGIAGAAFLIGLSGSFPLPFSRAVFYAIGVTLTAFVGRFLLRRVVQFSPSLPRLRDILGLIVLGAFGSSLVGASIGTSILYDVHMHGWSGFGKAWLIYWLGDSVAILLLTPLILSIPNMRKSRIWSHPGESIALLLFLTLTCLILFGDLPFIPVKLHILAFAVLPFVIWAALRFGVVGATVATFVIAGVATVETIMGFGPFAQDSPFINALLLDIFFAILSVSGLILAIVIEEREHAEKKRGELILKQAAMQERLRLAAIVESSDDAIIGKDVDGIVTDWNNGAEQLYGYSADEIIGKPISVLAPPGHVGEFTKIMETIRRGESIKHFETVRQTKSGNRIAVSLTVSPIVDPDGRIVGASAIARDISERKHQDAVLRESEERFRLMADSAPSLIWMSGTDKLCTYFNKPWLDFTGRSLDQEKGNGWVEGVHPDDVGRCMDIYTQAFDRQEEFRMEYRLRRHDGEYRWIFDIGRPRFNRDHSFAGYIGSCVDVTERRRAEEKVRESEERLRLAAQMGKMFAYDWDVASDFVLRSEEAPAILGIPSDSFRTTHAQVLARVHPEDRARLISLIASLTPEKPNITADGRFLRPDGSVLWLERTGRAFFDEQGRMVRMIGMIADITERKMSEEALSQVGGRLIEAHEEERAWIARELHDDIGQRLALLANYLELMEQDPPGSAAETRAYVSEQLKRLREISTDVQSLSHRLHSSKLRYLGIVAAARSFCQEVSKQHKVEVNFTHADITPDLPEEISLCLFRVIQEALHNAVKHSGGRRFEVELRGEPEGIHLVVRDSGIGIDLAAVVTNRGLGLVSMQERVKLVKGTISITSIPNSGTEVVVYVPLSGTRPERAKFVGA